MSLDIKKLENVSEKPDGKITARCPACAKDGRDRKGDHLIIFPDKKFGCVKYEKDAEHRKLIQALAGDGKRQAHVPSKLRAGLMRKASWTRKQIPRAKGSGAVAEDSQSTAPLQWLGRFGRV
jgi:hypothetical protein